MGTTPSQFHSGVFRVFDGADVTKKVSFDLSGITSGNVRTLIVPNQDGIISLVGHSHVESDISDLVHYDSSDFDTDFAGKDLDDLAAGIANVHLTTTLKSNYDIAYGWGDHAGLYESAGAITAHEVTYVHTDIALNTTHRGSDGSDHSKVGANETAIGFNTTHRGLVAGNPHQVTPTELGLVIDTDILAYDVGLHNLAGIAMVADKFYYTSADNVHVAGSVTAFARSILDDADEATFKTTVNLTIGTDVLAEQTIGIADNNLVEMDDTDAVSMDYARFTTNGIQGRDATEVKTDLGLVIGTNVQAWDASLDSIAGLTYVSDSFIKVTTEDTYAIRTIAETKTDLSLNLVENTALTTWAGTTSVTTLGTIATGIWAATDVAILHGGTGQSTVQAAIDALTAVSGATNEHVLTKDTATGNAIWKITAPPTLTAYTNLDSDSNSMVSTHGATTHAYKAVVAGWISFYSDSIDAGQTMSIYVGTTSDPIGAGTKVASQEAESGSNRSQTVSALVAKDEYFECYQDTGSGGIVLFKGFDTLGNPIDYD